ncbi:hypothetical protein BBP40_009634 [Aspergillus hancockii]|nr:hypothetical protein BBP40_009634 [Aspergillus hancockii]
MDTANAAIGLFQFAIKTLGRIQLARGFQDDFETHQLKLDIIQLRLSPWGEIASITTIDKNRTDNLASIKAVLGDI